MSTDSMTTSFADYVATQDARNTIQLNIRKYTLMLCECLTDDFTRRHPNSDPYNCLLYTSPSPRDVEESRMPSSA